MDDRSPPDDGASRAEAVLSRFGLEGPGDDWVGRVREAVAPTELGDLAGYELLERMGRGGQGLVYRARERATGRIVAIKRPLGGAFGTPSTRARFEREGLVDGALSHPNVVSASILTDESGQPLLAMEWIEGVPVDRWARGHDSRWRVPPGGDVSRSDGPHMERGGTQGPSRSDGPPERSVQERLRVFLKICRAVEHAHQRGVIHRDLKPSNILVDGAGEPHVLDFGLAKLVGPEADHSARLTRSEGFVGTLVYAAPEQLRPGRDGVDTRTDVYALGVILYQLLTDRLPHDPAGDLAAIVEAIQRVEPARPSAFVPGVDHDLDAIVARAMAKEKDRRYPSVDALAADVRRHMAGEPVEARHWSVTYVLRKAIRRHQAPIAAAAAFVLLVTGGAVASTLLWRRAERESRAARAEAEKATLIADFLSNLLKSLDPESRDADLLRVLLDGAGKRLAGGELAGAPGAEVHVRLEIGRGYRSIGACEQAEETLRPALDLARTTYGPAHAEVVWVLHELGHTLAADGRPDGALEMHREALRTLDRLGIGDDHHRVENLKDVAECLNSMGRPADALPRAQEALAIGERLYEGDHADLALSLGIVADCLEAVGRPEEALPRYEDALAMCRRLHPGDHPEVATSLNNLATCLWRALGRPSDALPLFGEALAMRERVVGGDHPRLLTNYGNLAGCLQSLSRFEEARATFERGLAMARRLYPGDHPQVALLLHHVADAHRAGGDSVGAELPAAEAVEMYRRHADWDAGEHAHALWVLADVCQARDRTEEAVALMREAANTARHPAAATWLAPALARLGMLLVASGEYSQAEPILRECLAIRLASIPDNDPTVWLRFNTMSLLGGALAGQGAALRESDPDRAAARFAEAEPLLLDGYAGMRDKPEALPVRKREALERIVALYHARGKPDKAAEYRVLLEAPPAPP